MEKRVQILVQGIVQGVGFRPYVYTLANRYSLKGQVFNNTLGVVIDIEGEAGDVEQFISDIRSSPPPLSLIESVERRDDLSPAEFTAFNIKQSALAGARAVGISPDIATCLDCLRELSSRQDRRYRYPFINCTNCGPRFTIIEATPYDRAQTTMRDFAMCADCQAEYENPLDRRFHAEPIACAVCGPRLFLTDAGRNEIALEWGEDIISRAQSLLLNGAIIAIKGLGGFHLACDALNTEAVDRLRKRKYRAEKPFALMANSIEIIREYCAVSKAEEQLLLSPRRPIVLLDRRPGVDIPNTIAAGLNTLGFFLPYTPLHYLLMENGCQLLVMTSGNIADEPICYQDSEAANWLNTIADYFLLHNRRIHMRADDSVTRVRDGKEMILRRSRGYAPASIKTALKFSQQILACGAELKSTFCLARDDRAFISHHIGDLENLETLQSFTSGIEHFKRLFDLHPEIIAYDLHPEYLSTKYALSQDDFADKLGVQHHHAHIASCLADNNIDGNYIDGEVLGVAMDGLGFGEDGNFWGGEFFVADLVHAERVAHLDYIAMPGGAKAIREPWRIAAIYLQRAFGDNFLELKMHFVDKLDRHAWQVLRQMAANGINSPLTSSIGRLFDAVASLVGLRQIVCYEGQAAIELETIADESVTNHYQFEVASNGIIKLETMIQSAVEDLLNGISPAAVSTRFHLTIAHLIAALALRIRDERHINRVALSGGVFQNMLLLKSTRQLLNKASFEVYTHSRVPTNDGGISLGQAVVANARLAAGRI